MFTIRQDVIENNLLLEEFLNVLPDLKASMAKNLEQQTKKYIYL